MVPEGNRSTSSSAEQVPLAASQHVSQCDADTTSPTPGSCGADRVVRSQRRGPRTKAGKARVACNALTHGLTSARPVVSGERPQDWTAHCRDVLEALAPMGPVERALAERVASVLWRLPRVTAYEAAAIAGRHDLESPSAPLLPSPFELDRIIRYEAHLSRQLYQALHELEAMRAQRRGQETPLVRVDVQDAPSPVAVATVLPS